MDAVEILREASRRALARAEAADPHNPRRWEVIATADGDSTVDIGGSSLGQCPDCGVRAGFEHAEAEHVASWDPKVATAVAMVWTEVAYQIAENDLPYSDPIASEAIEAARAYLGEASS